VAQPLGTPLHIAAAATFAGYSDLVYALMPNGRTLDSQVTSATADLSPVGVEKESFDGGLFATGADGGYHAPPGVDPQADLTGWYAAITVRAVHHIRGRIDNPPDREVPLTVLPAGRSLRNRPGTACAVAPCQRLH
jgi:hypothetical protein